MYRKISTIQKKYIFFHPSVDPFYPRGRLGSPAGENFLRLKSSFIFINTNGGFLRSSRLEPIYFLLQTKFLIQKIHDKASKIVQIKFIIIQQLFDI